MPLYHQLRMIIDRLEVGHPQRIIYTLHTSPVVGISSSGNELDPDLFGELTHHFCHIPLPVVSVSTQVVGDEKIVPIFIRNFNLYSLALPQDNCY